MAAMQHLCRWALPPILAEGFHALDAWRVRPERDRAAEARRAAALRASSEAMRHGRHAAGCTRRGGPYFRRANKMMAQIVENWLHAERQKLIEGWARLDGAICQFEYAVAKFERLKAKSKAKPVPPICEARLKQIVAADRERAERSRKRKRSH
jgi:hypothetical protein